MATGDRNLKATGKAAILFAMLLTVYAMVGLTAVLPAIEARFHATPGAGPLVRSLVTAVAFSMIFGAPLAGMMGDKFGRKHVLVLAILLYALAGTAGLFISNLWVLLGSRVVLGFATAATGTLLITLATTAFDGAERDKWLGWLMTTSTVGALLLIPIAGVLGHISWRGPFVLHLIALPLLALVLIGIPADVERAEAEKGHAGVSPKVGFPWALALSALGSGVVCSSANLFLPFHLRDIAMGDTTRISMALLPSILAGGVAAAFFGRIRQHLSVSMVFLGCLVLSGAGMVALGMAVTMAAVIAAQIAIGIGSGLLAPNMFALAAATSLPQHRARNIGIVKGLFAGGPFFGQVLLEPVAQSTSQGGAILALGLASLAVAGLWTARWKRSSLHS